MDKSKKDEILELLREIDPEGDFDGMVPQPNHSFDGVVHSVMEIETGKIYLSQGEVENDLGLVIAIDRKGRYEELQPGEYQIHEILAWNPETDDLEIVPYEEEQ